jgi:hypothetical protein
MGDVEQSGENKSLFSPLFVSLHEKSNKGTVLLLIHGISDIMHKNVVGDDFAKGSKRKK